MLAAGESRRMGRPKLLLHLGGEPIVRRVVRRVTELKCGQTIVVLGHNPEPLRESLAGLIVQFAVNSDYSTGIASSFRTAIDSVDAAANGAFFVFGDQPLVTVDDYTRCLAAHARSKPALVAARYGEVIAPPYLFDRRLFSMVGIGSGGVQAFARDHRDEVAFVDLPLDALIDIDTPADYERAKALIASTPA